MELLQWLHLLNDLAVSTSQSQNNLNLSLNIANSLFVAYVLLALITKKVAPLAAFFLSVLLVDNVYMMKIGEPSMYLLVAAIYLHVFETCLTAKQKGCCVIILLTAIFLSMDAALYGKHGVYEENETFIYRNIEYISLCAHGLFISSFICLRKIRNSIRNFISSLSRFSATSDYMLFYCYNLFKSKLLQ